MAYRDCPHTPGVVCDSKGSCERCGWYPPEGGRRLQDIRDGKMSKGFWGMLKLRIKKSRPSGANAESGTA